MITTRDVMFSKLDKQTIISEFISNWVPHISGFVSSLVNNKEFYLINNLIVGHVQ